MSELATTTTRDRLLALLEATPEAPSADADPHDVIVRAKEVVSARASIMGDFGFDPLSEKDAIALEPILTLIRERDEAWRAAMVRARHVLGVRLGATQRLRRSRY